MKTRKELGQAFTKKMREEKMKTKAKIKALKKDLRETRKAIKRDFKDRKDDPDLQ